MMQCTGTTAAVSPLGSDESSSRLCGSVLATHGYIKRGIARN